MYNTSAESKCTGLNRLYHGLIFKSGRPNKKRYKNVVTFSAAEAEFLMDSNMKRPSVY